MRVPYSEGVANHTDPLSCVGHREVSGEAFGRGEHRPAIEPRKLFQPGMPTPCWVRKATWTGATSQGPVQSRVVEDPGMCRRSLYGNREVSRVTVNTAVRIGKVRSRSR